MVQTVRQTIGIPQFFFDKVYDGCVAQVVQVVVSLLPPTSTTTPSPHHHHHLASFGVSAIVCPCLLRYIPFG